MPFNYEYEKRLRVGYIGAGEHSYRDILPCFQYAPIELVALADHHPERGLAIARQFGARHFYPNHKALLAKEELDAVFIVVGPDETGKPRYPELAVESLKAGFHTWIDQPPCASASDIATFTNGCLAKGKYVATGFHKMFVPAYQRVGEILLEPNFGGVSSYSMRYPVSLPPVDKRGDALAMAPFLDFVQPYAVLHHLFGDCEGCSYLRSQATGAVVINLRHRGGVIGNLYLTAGQAETSPLERLEVIGQGANLVVENATRLTYYRPGGSLGEGVRGRSESYWGPHETAPIIWEPEFSRGELYNKDLFLNGYVGSVRHFAERLLAGDPPKIGNLLDMLSIMTVCDKIRNGKENQWIS